MPPPPLKDLANNPRDMGEGKTGMESHRSRWCAHNLLCRSSTREKLMNDWAALTLSGKRGRRALRSPCEGDGGGHVFTIVEPPRVHFDSGAGLGLCVLRGPAGCLWAEVSPSPAGGLTASFCGLCCFSARSWSGLAFFMVPVVRCIGRTPSGRTTREPHLRFCTAILFPRPSPPPRLA